MNSKSSFTRRSWLVLFEKDEIFSNERLSSVQKIQTTHPSERPSLCNAMKRDSSAPLSSYFQGRRNRAFLQSLPVGRASNSRAKSKTQLCTLLRNSRKCSTETARRFRTPRPLAAISFFLGQT